MTRLRKKIIIILTALMLCAVVLLSIFAALVLSFKAPFYEAEAVMWVDSRKSVTALTPDYADIKSNMTTVRNHMELLVNDIIIRQVVENLTLHEDTTPTSAPSRLQNFLLSMKSMISKDDSDTGKKQDEALIIEAIKILKESITLETPPFTNIINISVKHENAEQSAQIANNLVERYIQWHIELRQKDAQTLLQHVNKKMTKAENKLEEAEENLSLYREENNINNLSEQEKTYIDEQSEFQKAYAQADIQEQELKARIKQTKQAVRMAHNSISRTVLDSPIIGTLEGNKLAAEIELSQLQELYMDSSPQVINMKKRVDLVTQKLDRTISQLKTSDVALSAINPVLQGMMESLLKDESTLKTIGPKKEVIQKWLSDTTDKLTAISAKKSELLQLSRRIQTKEKNYQTLVEESEKIQLFLDKQTLEHIKFISKASPPLKAKGRSKNMILCCLIIGMMLATVYLTLNYIFRFS